MSVQLLDDQAPGLTQALVALLGDVHLLISDGHYKAAGEQLSLAVQTTLFQPAAIDRAVAAAEKARFPLREGPFGGYDYGHNNSQPVKGGRYVIRDFRDPSSPDWGKWIHQTDNHDEHEALRSEEHTSELQSLMRISYAVFCLKK